jgi:hypothetical protein
MIWQAIALINKLHSFIIICRGTAATDLLPFAKDLNCRAPTANTHHL